MKWTERSNTPQRVKTTELHVIPQGRNGEPARAIDALEIANTGVSAHPSYLWLRRARHMVHGLRLLHVAIRTHLPAIVSEFCAPFASVGMRENFARVED